LWKSETKHGHQFVNLILQECNEKVVFVRLEELMKLEADIVKNLALRPALH
jgi:tRNA-(ms[2]io[6]A)-hydroxylase